MLHISESIYVAFQPIKNSTAQTRPECERSPALIVEVER